MRAGSLRGRQGATAPTDDCRAARTSAPTKNNGEAGRGLSRLSCIRLASLLSFAQEQLLVASMQISFASMQLSFA